MVSEPQTPHRDVLSAIVDGNAGTAKAAPDLCRSFGRDGEMLGVEFFVGRIIAAISSIVRKEGWQVFDRTITGCLFHLAPGHDKPQRFRQPATAIEQTFGLLRHVALLQMVDQPNHLLAPGFTHRFEDARLGDPAQVVGSSGLPTCLCHIEADGAGDMIGERDPVC